jgi:hypothetical protein
MKESGRKDRAEAPYLLRKHADNYIKTNKGVKGLYYNSEKIGQWLRGNDR